MDSTVRHSRSAHTRPGLELGILLDLRCDAPAAVTDVDLMRPTLHRAWRSVERKRRVASRATGSVARREPTGWVPAAPESTSAGLRRARPGGRATRQAKGPGVRYTGVDDHRGIRMAQQQVRGAPSDAAPPELDAAL